MQGHPIMPLVNISRRTFLHWRRKRHITTARELVAMIMWRPFTMTMKWKMSLVSL